MDCQIQIMCLETNKSYTYLYDENIKIGHLINNIKANIKQVNKIEFNDVNLMELDNETLLSNLEIDPTSIIFVDVETIYNLSVSIFRPGLGKVNTDFKKTFKNDNMFYQIKEEITELLEEREIIKEIIYKGRPLLRDSKIETTLEDLSLDSGDCEFIILIKKLPPPPEPYKYLSQIDELRALGFTEESYMRSWLNAYKGDVNKVAMVML